MQTLDILFTGPKDFLKLLEGLFSDRFSGLKRLSLNRHPDSFESDLLAPHLYRCLVKNKRRRCFRLESLRLSSFDVKEVFEPLEALVDLSMLVELHLSECMEADEFLQDLGRKLKENQMSPPLHHPYAGRIPFSNSLDDLLDCSENLSEFSLIAGNSEINSLWARIHRIGPSLKLLGLHTFRQGPFEDFLKNGDHDFFWKPFFKACPNLEQLGYQLQERDLELHEWEYADGFLGRWASDFLTLRSLSMLTRAQENIRYLRNLRTSHFRFFRYRELDGDEVEQHKRLGEIGFEFQRFANSFFQYLDRVDICPKLNAIIIG